MKTARRVPAIFAVLIPLAFPSLLQASPWDIDPAHTSVEFKVRHLMVSNVRGRFHGVKGVIDLEGEDFSGSVVDVTIDAATIDTGVEKRDAHLRSPDFFDVEKFPTITFRSKEVSSAGPGELKVVGDITIHGVTKEVVLDVEGPTQAITDPWGNVRVGAAASTKINRKDFGLTWNKVLEGGGVVVGEEIKITIETELLKRVPKE
jgi:polyisoprenoid-binding protein YceI